MQYSNSNYEKQFITPLPLCQLKSVSSAHFFDLALLKNFISSIIFSNRYAAPARSGSKWKFQAFLPKNASDFPPYRAHPPAFARAPQEPIPVCIMKCNYHSHPAFARSARADRALTYPRRGGFRPIPSASAVPNGAASDRPAFLSPVISLPRLALKGDPAFTRMRAYIF